MGLILSETSRKWETCGIFSVFFKFYHLYMYGVLPKSACRPHSRIGHTAHFEGGLGTAPGMVQ